MSGPRYAAYWAPARVHPLWDLGCAWLGRDAEHADRTSPSRVHTEEPRLYGFHATLKAPMPLADGVNEQHWLDVVQAIARTTAPFAMPRLHVALLGNFVALRPVSEPDAAHPLRRLADRCVIELDVMRGTVVSPDIARRLEGLDARRADLARRYGYPFVLDEWRFHMTLSDPLADPTSMVDEATAYFADALALPLPSDELAVFVQRARGAPFELTHRFALTGITR